MQHIRVEKKSVIHYNFHLNCLSNLQEVILAHGMTDAFLSNLENTEDCMTLQPKYQPVTFPKDVPPYKLVRLF